ncbi:helix-turn-helix transcriptional regulator [Eubacterium sp. 1001713B170207_170306_E7]|uniref:helix-turn-helix domain-containing protein n=1 Tax=Eubacterium sp. 1001713B170207_170306_E7 TaxID=2787097 RepID=UPI001899BF4B|nr:helix-turn-helix transcriptional regulator [Eubacterium sp. 1001713B170207_170306_E7]
MVYFGSKLRQLRQEKGYTQQQLADMLGITKGSVSAYETSAKYPSVDVLRKIAVTLNTSTDFLLGLSDERVFNLDFLTDDQIHIINSLITEFNHLNNKNN